LIPLFIWPSSSAPPPGSSPAASILGARAELCDRSAGWDIRTYPRGDFLGYCVRDICETILAACCDAWNAMIAKPEIVASIGTRDLAQVKI
jgi:hypothetical protein